MYYLYVDQNQLGYHQFDQITAGQSTSTDFREFNFLGIFCDNKC